jgi:hypothetical protein
MKLTQDVRELGQAQAHEAEAGMADKAKEFQRAGGEIYVTAQTPRRADAS